MANNDKENKIKKFTKEAIGKTLNQFNKEIGIADLVEVNKNQDRILNGILSQVNDESTEKTEKSNVIMLDNSTDGIVELKEIQGDTNVNVSKIVEETPITHVIEDKEGNVISLDDITEGAINIDNIQGNTMVNCNKEADKELILMEDLSTEGYSNITLNKGVDGGLVDVALEGNTMVNVCDQKDPVAITKSYTVETGNHVALQGEYDGKCRPVVSGNTLVNLVGSLFTINNNPNYVTMDEYGVITNKIYSNSFSHIGLIDMSKFKPSTTYTIITDVIENNVTIVDDTYTGAVIMHNINNGITCYAIPPYKSYYNLGETGIRVSKFTTPSDLSKYGNNHLKFMASPFGKAEGSYKLKAMLLEGDYTNKPIPKYFEGLQSSFEDKVVTQEMIDAGEELAENLGKYKVEVVVTGKNKFDKSKTLDGYELVSKGNVSINRDWFVATINVLPNTSYKISGKGNGYNIALYDYNKNLIGYDTSGANGTFITPSNCRYIMINGLLTQKDTFQLEEGTEATPYEPYKEYKKTFYLNSPLLEGDTIEQQGDNVVHVHRYGKVVLDGNNVNLSLASTNDSTKYRWSVYRSNDIASGNIDINIINDKYIALNASDTWMNIEGLSSSSDKTFYLYLEKYSDGSDTSKQALLSELQQNPITVVYQLATPQYEVISQNDTILCDSYVNGHLDVDSVVPIEKVDFLPFEEELTYLYPSTQYAVQFVSNAVSKVDITLGGTKLLNQDVIVGTNKYTITTPSELIDNNLVLNGEGFNASNIVVTKATDQDFGYFEGMKSVGECEDLEVVSCNKNLFPLNHEFEVGSLDSEGFPVDNSVRRRSKNFIKVNPTNDITLFAQGVNWVCIVAYDRNKKYIAQSSADYTKISLHSDKLIYYVKIQTDVFSTITNIQIEEGSTATDYIPHAHNTQTLTHEPLRAVGDAKDKYVLIDGKWYIERNCGVRNNYSICDAWSNENLTNRRLKLFKLDNSIEEFDNMNALRKVKSNKFKCVQYGYTDGRFNVPFLAYITENGNLWVSADINYTQQDMLNYIKDCQFVYELPSPIYEPIDYNPFTVYSDTTHISNNSTIPCNMTIKNTGYNCLLKPSTTYTVSSNLGLNLVTTPSVLTEDCLRFYDTDTSSVTTMKNVTILEGDYTTGKPLPSHFSGIESAFEQEYDEVVGKYKVKAKVVGKNLFNGEWHNGWLSISNGNILPSNNYKYCDYIRVPSNAKIRVKCSFDIPEYDYNKNFIKNNGGGRTTITTSSNCYYIRIDVRNPQDISNYQVEEGTEATPYEPYKENYIEFYIDEPLRGIGNVKDEVYIKNDKVVVERNCGSVTFDGSDDENWIMMNNNTNFIRFDIEHPNVSKVAIAKELIKSNTFNYGKDENCITNHSTLSKFIIFINKNKLLTQDILGFKQWLQQNPTTVVYQLAEPTYEEVEYSESRLFLNTYNNSTLFYESNIPVSNTSFKPLWEELVYIKNSTKYYIQFNAVGSGEVVINLGGTELTTEIVEGYNCIPITTPSESTNLMTISGQGITISEVVVSEVICGGHYKGLQSCFEEHMENGKYRVLLRGIALDGSKVNGIKLYINEPLRGIGNIKDRLCIKNGKLVVERRCGEIVFDGSDDEIWDILSFNFVNHTKATTKNIPNLKGTDNYRLANSYCDKFIQLTESPNFGNDTQEYYAIGTTSIEISINNSKLSSPNNVNGIKKWLQQNPTKIIYELKNPVYEEVTNEYGLPIVFEGYENGIVYIDSAVTPTTHIKYTSNNQLATTLAEAEEQNIATQEDINMNVITYMMDIDMMLTDMEMSNDISVMAVRRDNSNENMLDRMSDEDKKVYRDNTVVMLEKMITANVLEKEDIEGRINIYYDKNRISKEQYKYLKSLL